MSAISGSLLFRDTLIDQKLPKGKKLMLVMGVVAVDEDFSIKTDHIVRVKDGDTMFPDIFGAKVMMVQDGGTPLDTKYRGWDASDLFQQPIWRA